MKRYGVTFIAGYTFGGYFTGCYSMQMDSESEKSDIHASVSAHYSGLFASGSASAAMDIEKIANTHNVKRNCGSESRGFYVGDSKNAEPAAATSLGELIRG